MRLKQLLLGTIVFLPLLAAGCSDNNAAIKKILADVTILKQIPIQVSVPKTWVVLPEAELDKVGPQIIFAASDSSVDGQGVRNMNIVEERLINPLSSLQYSYANISLAAQNLRDYVKLSETDVVIKDENNTDVKTKLHVFQARFDTKNPKRTYIQLYAARGYKGYSVTVQTVLDEKNLTELSALATSFRLVKE